MWLLCNSIACTSVQRTNLQPGCPSSALAHRAAKPRLPVLMRSARLPHRSTADRAAVEPSAPVANVDGQSDVGRFGAVRSRIPQVRPDT